MISGMAFHISTRFAYVIILNTINFKINEYFFFVPHEATLHSRGYFSILLSGKSGTFSSKCLLVDRDVKDVQ